MGKRWILRRGSPVRLYGTLGRKKAIAHLTIFFLICEYHGERSKLLCGQGHEMLVAVNLASDSSWLARRIECSHSSSNSN